MSDLTAAKKLRGTRGQKCSHDMSDPATGFNLSRMARGTGPANETCNAKILTGPSLQINAESAVPVLELIAESLEGGNERSLKG